MALALSDLFTPLTSTEVTSSIYSVLSALGVDTTSWRPGSVARAIITGTSIVAAGLSQVISAFANGAFLETASGDQLTVTAYYVFGVDRVAATFANGTLTLVNSGGGVYTKNADELIVSNPDTQTTYRNSSAFTLGSGQTITIPIVSTVAGSDGSAVPGAITNMITPLLGVTCTNPTALVGLDEESDSDLKTRCLEKLGALSPNGPWDAYTYVARNSTRSDGTSIGVTRVKTTWDGYGNVNVYVATATGGVTGTAADITTDLGAISDQIQRQAVPLAVTANVLSATPTTVDVTCQVWIYNTTGRTNDEITTAIETALASYLGTRPVGGDVVGVTGAVYQSDLLGVIWSTFPEIFRVQISTPSGDVALSANAVPVLGTVTATITQVAPPSGTGL